MDNSKKLTLFKNGTDDGVGFIDISILHHEIQVIESRNDYQNFVPFADNLGFNPLFTFCSGTGSTYCHNQFTSCGLFRRSICTGGYNGACAQVMCGNIFSF